MTERGPQDGDLVIIGRRIFVLDEKFADRRAWFVPELEALDEELEPSEHETKTRQRTLATAPASTPAGGDCNDPPSETTAPDQADARSDGPAQAPETADGGGGEGATQDPPEEHNETFDLRDRLQGFRKSRGLTAAALIKQLGIATQTYYTFMKGGVSQETRDKIREFLDAKDDSGQSDSAEDPGGDLDDAEEVSGAPSLKAMVLEDIDKRGIKPGDAPEYYGIRKASFLGLMNGGPPPIEDTVFALAAKIPAVADRLDEFLVAREAWEQERAEGARD